MVCNSLGKKPPPTCIIVRFPFFFIHLFENSFYSQSQIIIELIYYLSLILRQLIPLLFLILSNRFLLQQKFSVNVVNKIFA